MPKKTKKPTRRKPDRPMKRLDYSIDDDCLPGWALPVWTAVIISVILGVPALMSWTHLQGWW